MISRLLQGRRQVRGRHDIKIQCNITNYSLSNYHTEKKIIIYLYACICCRAMIGLH